MSATTVTMRARYTGNREICFRWVGAVGSGELRHAQSFPGVEVVSDTWLSEPDARVKSSTLVRLPVDLVVLDSCKSGAAAEHAYTAGVLDGADQKNTINWTRARYISTRRTRREGREIVTHTIDVDGARGEYIETID